MLVSKLITFTLVHLSPIDKPIGASPVSHCLTHLPDLSLKLEKRADQLLSISILCFPAWRSFYVPASGMMPSSSWSDSAVAAASRKSSYSRDDLMCSKLCFLILTKSLLHVQHACTNTMMQIDRLQVFWSKRYYLKGKRFSILNSKWWWDSLFY